MRCSFCERNPEIVSHSRNCPTKAIRDDLAKQSWFRGYSLGRKKTKVTELAPEEKGSKYFMSGFNRGQRESSPLPRRPRQFYQNVLTLVFRDQ